eukprot:739525-Rhodomonas_salina.1
MVAAGCTPLSPTRSTQHAITVRIYQQYHCIRLGSWYSASLQGSVSDNFCELSRPLRPGYKCIGYVNAETPRSDGRGVSWFLVPEDIVVLLLLLVPYAIL